MPRLNLKSLEAEFEEFLSTHEEEPEPEVESSRKPMDWTHHLYGPRRETGWMKDAACRGMGWELFFPEHGDGQTSVDAKKVCVTCPVQGECLTYAVEYNEEHGVWGGQTNRGIRRARKVRNEQNVVTSQ